MLGVVSLGYADDGVNHYSVPKQAAAPAAAPATVPGPQAGGKADLVPVDFQLPADWKPTPQGEMDYARFAIGADEAMAILTITPLGHEPRVTANVNRWEGQLGLDPTPEASMATLVKQVDIGGEKAATVDLNNGQARMLAAIVAHDGVTWFFKLAGPAQTVAAQKANFDAFLKSVHFNVLPAAPVVGMPQLPAGHPALPGQNAGGTNLPAGHPALPGNDGPGGPLVPLTPPTAGQGMILAKFATPTGWQADAQLKPLRIASFQIVQGEGHAEVSVLKLALNSGSLLDNYNRWRQQVGLAAVTQVKPTDLPSVEVSGKKGMLVDLAGPEAAGTKPLRMILAIVSDGSDDWFFKLVGPADLVCQQKAAFEGFLKSVELAPAGK